MQLLETGHFVRDAPVDPFIWLDSHYQLVSAGASQLRNLARGFPKNNPNLDLLLLEGLAGRQDERDAGPARPAYGRGLAPTPSPQVSRGRIDGVAASCRREDAIAATVLSDTQGRPRLGPKQLKIQEETTHDLV